MQKFHAFNDNIPTGGDVDVKLLGSEVNLYYSKLINDQLVNSAYNIRCTAERLPALIEEVESYFTEHKRKFHWAVSSTDTPDLEKLLLERGYNVQEEAHVLTLQLTDERISSIKSGEVEIREVRYTAMLQMDVLQLIADAFGNSVELTHQIITQQEQAEKKLGVHYAHFLTFEKEIPVAFATSMYLPKGNIMKLGGAATRNEFRNRGIYSALVKKRLLHAQAHGMKLAIIDARADSSAPILQKLGFVNQGFIRSYVRE